MRIAWKWFPIAGWISFLIFVPAALMAQDDIRVALIFPSVKEDDQNLTGLAVANPTEQVALVAMFLLDDDGEIVEGPGIVNPAAFPIQPQRQEAGLLREFFGGQELEGWVLLVSDNMSVVGFFIQLTPDAQRIDGAEATVLRLPLPTLVFPEILTGPESFTEINLIGITDEVVTATLELVRESGTVAASRQIELPQEGRFQARVADLFSPPFPAQAYLRVRASHGIVGYQSFGTDRFIGGRNAIEIIELGRKIPFSLFGAQFAEGFGFTTEVTVINPTDEDAEIEVLAFSTAASSAEPAARRSWQIPAGGMIRESGRTLVNLPPGDFLGWIRINSDVAGIVGSLTFGDPPRNFLASVQLQSSPFPEAIFSHVADGLGYFTGITFVNIFPDTARVEVEVFNVNGDLTGKGEFELRPFEHRPRVLTEIIPGFKPQIGGFVRIVSNLPLFTFELFGFADDNALASLAAVPPQRGNGTVSGQIQPALTAASLGAPSPPWMPGQEAFPASAARSILLRLADEFVPGEVIVKLRSGQTNGRMAALAAPLDLTIELEAPEEVYLLKRRQGQGAVLLWQEGASSDALEMEKRALLNLIEELNRRPEVEYAHPNYIYHPSRVPTDPGYPLQWHYEYLALAAAWEITTGSEDIVVAVVDSGAKFGHPDLAPRLTGGQFDFISDPQRALDGDGIDPIAEDEGDDPNRLFSTFHGTHVAGTIGAATDNALGVAGVDWVAPLMTLRVLGVGGGTEFDISQAIRYAARLPNASNQLPARQARVINMSLGGRGSGPTLQQAVAAALNAGSIIVAAAGNENSDEPHFPASFEGVISVGAIDLSGGKAPYSNFGPRIDVVAPGGNMADDRNGDGFPDGVLSTSWLESTNEPGWKFSSGTSMAAPHVAGVVSLMLAVNPGLAPAQVRRILQETAIDLGPPGRDDTFGYGLVNPVAALREAGSLAPEDPRLVVSATTLNFGKTTTQFRVTVSNGGGGTLNVGGTLEMDQGGNWLSGFLSANTLTVEVDRAGLPNGRYTGRIRLTSNGGDSTIEVIVDVGPVEEEDIGTVFVLILDPRTFNTINTTVAFVQDDYEYQFSPTFAGEYVIAAGTDDDENGFICEEGEYCGLYPVFSRPDLVPVEMNRDTAGVDFLVERLVGLQGTEGPASLRDLLGRTLSVMPAEGGKPRWKEGLERRVLEEWRRFR